jgi:hypothetical protein
MTYLPLSPLFCAWKYELAPSTGPPGDFSVLQDIGSTAIFGTLWLYKQNEQMDRVQYNACVSVK